jgi:predicted nucleotidyltransferase
MRRCALDFMSGLDAFHPRLIGSVASGHIRPGSDIDLHVFTDDPDQLATALDAREWTWDHTTVLVRRGADFEEYLHILIDAAFPVELSVYPCAERRRRPRSSTDGKPIDRLTPARVAALIDNIAP